MVKNKKYISALDIGTSKVIALIGEVQDPEQRARLTQVFEQRQFALEAE